MASTLEGADRSRESAKTRAVPARGRSWRALGRFAPALLALSLACRPPGLPASAPEHDPTNPEAPIDRYSPPPNPFEGSAFSGDGTAPASEPDGVPTHDRDHGVDQPEPTDEHENHGAHEHEADDKGAKPRQRVDEHAHPQAKEQGA
jgi:hypothetical protein